jgi:UPF0716 protein FxsA
VPFLFLLFLVVPIAELYVIIQVGQAIGILPTLGLLLLDSIVGTWLVRSQGRAAWRRFRLALQEGRAPATETIDGGLVLLGGAFLLAPGFLTDAFGVALLLPPSRALIRRSLARRLVPRMVGSIQVPRQPAPRAYDVEGKATDTTDGP